MALCLAPGGGAGTTHAGAADLTVLPPRVVDMRNAHAAGSRCVGVLNNVSNMVTGVRAVIA